MALDAARRVLWCKGLAGASLDAIAEAAQINRPSLAAAFGDKTEIYAKAAGEYGKQMEERLRQALQADDLRTALIGAFDAAISVYTQTGLSGCFVFSTAAAEAENETIARQVLRAAIEGVDALFEGRLREAAQKGELKPEADPKALATLFGATLQSLALRARAGSGVKPLKALARQAVSTLVTE